MRRAPGPTGAGAPPGGFRRIALLRLSSLGDVILALPVAHALARAFPGAHLTFWTKEEYADVVRFDPATGAFRAPGEPAPFAVGISGEDPVALGWTFRLAERLGCVIEPEDGRYDAVIRVIGAGIERAWELERAGRVTRIATIEELSEGLGRLVAVARERSEPS